MEELQIMPGYRMTAETVIKLCEDAWSMERASIRQACQDAGLDPEATYRRLREHDGQRGDLQPVVRSCVGVAGATAVLAACGIDATGLDHLGGVQRAALEALGVDTSSLDDKEANGKALPFSVVRATG